MCIKLAYLRGLVKSTARIFCFGRKPTKLDEALQKTDYFEDELSEKREVACKDPHLPHALETVISQPQTLKDLSKEDFAIAVIDKIMGIEFWWAPYRAPAIDLWRSMLTIKTFTDLDLEAQAAACLTVVSRSQFKLDRVRSVISTYLTAPQDDLMICRRFACKVFFAAREVYWILQNYEQEHRDAAMEIAKSLIEEAQAHNSASAVAEAACYLVARECRQAMLKDNVSQPEIQKNLSENRVIAVIDEIINIEFPDAPYKANALALWTNVSKIKEFTDLDVEAQAAACLHVVAHLDYGTFVFDREISTYLRASQQDLVQCRELAFRVFSIRREIEWILQLYPMEDRDAAMDFAIILMDRTPQIKNSGSIAIAAGYLALVNQGYNIKLKSMIPVLDLRMAPLYRDLPKVKRQYAQGRKDIEMLVREFLKTEKIDLSNL